MPNLGVLVLAVQLIQSSIGRSQEYKQELLLAVAVRCLDLLMAQLPKLPNPPRLAEGVCLYLKLEPAGQQRSRVDLSREIVLTIRSFQYHFLRFLIIPPTKKRGLP